MSGELLGLPADEHEPTGFRSSVTSTVWLPSVVWLVTRSIRWFSARRPACIEGWQTSMTTRSPSWLRVRCVTTLSVTASCPLMSRRVTTVSETICGLVCDIAGGGASTIAPSSVTTPCTRARRQVRIVLVVPGSFTCVLPRHRVYVRGVDTGSRPPWMRWRHDRRQRVLRAVLQGSQYRAYWCVWMHTACAARQRCEGGRSLRVSARGSPTPLEGSAERPYVRAAPSRGDPAAITLESSERGSRADGINRASKPGRVAREGVLSEAPIRQLRPRRGCTERDAVIEQGERRIATIIKIYVEPNLSPDEIQSAANRRSDHLQAFSETCRRELDALAKHV
jgi:hypothetical protein